MVDKQSTCPFADGAMLEARVHAALCFTTKNSGCDQWQLAVNQQCYKTTSSWAMKQPLFQQSSQYFATNRGGHHAVWWGGVGGCIPQHDVTFRRPPHPPHLLVKGLRFSHQGLKGSFVFL